MSPRPELVTITQAAALVGCSRFTMHRRVNDGTIPVYERVGVTQTVQLRKSDVMAYARKHTDRRTKP